jgi:hypothetical protein
MFIYIYGGYVVFLSHVHKMMHIHYSSVDIRCNKSWEANLLCKNPHKNDKIQVQVHYSVNAHEICHFHEFFKIDFVSQFFIRRTSMDVHRFIIFGNL